MELDDLSDQESARHSYHMASFLFGKSGLPNEVEEQVMRDPAYYPTLIRSETGSSIKKAHLIHFTDTAEPWLREARLDKYLVILVTIASTITLGLKAYTMLTPDWIRSTALSHKTIGIGLLKNCSLASCQPTTLTDAPYFFTSNILVVLSLLLLLATLVLSVSTVLFNNTDRRQCVVRCIIILISLEVTLSMGTLLLIVFHKLELKTASYWKFGDCFFYHLIALTLSCVSLILQAVLFMHIQPIEPSFKPLHPLHLQQSNDYNSSRHTKLAHNLTNNFTSKYMSRDGTLT